VYTLTAMTTKQPFEIRKSFSNNGITQCVSLPKAVADYIELESGAQLGVWQKQGRNSIALKDGDIVIRKMEVAA